MIEKYLSAQQIWFTDCPRHWSQASENFTGADSLITALRQGWQAASEVYQHDFLHSGGRITVVYTFTLHLNADVRHMAIISTPLIVRLLSEQAFTVLMRDAGDSVEENQEERLLSQNTAI